MRPPTISTNHKIHGIEPSELSKRSLRLSVITANSLSAFW